MCLKHLVTNAPALIQFQGVLIGYTPTSERYKRRAKECRALAEQAHDEHERATILQMAEQWERLAEDKAKKETAN